MKRLISIIAVILCITVLFTACQTNSGNENTSNMSNSQTNDGQTSDSQTSSNQSNLPVYVPGSIKLVPQDEDYYDFERPYRICYYSITGEFLDLLTKKEETKFLAWLDESYEETNHSETLNEMRLVTFIKRYNISREKFDEVVLGMIESYKKLGFDMTSEEHEIPNADIIYTFDNDIINEYYRYE